MIIDLDIKKCLSLRKESTDKGINYIIVAKEKYSNGQFKICSIKDIDLLAKKYEDINFNKNISYNSYLKVDGVRINAKIFEKEWLNLIIDIYEEKRREIELQTNNRLAMIALEIIERGYETLFIDYQVDEEKFELLKMTMKKLETLVKDKLTTYEVKNEN